MSTISPASSASITFSLARLPACLNTCYAHLSLSPPKTSFTQKSEKSFQNTNKIIALFAKPITYRVKTKSHTSVRICLIHLLLSSPASYIMYSPLFQPHQISFSFENSVCLFGTKALHIVLLFKTLFFIP